MARLRIHYELTRVVYAGEPVGVDWTLFVHTGAGLVSLDAKLEPGVGLSAPLGPRRVGARDLELPERDDLADPVEPPERADPAELADPADPAELADPADPAELADPADPADPGDPPDARVPPDPAASAQGSAGAAAHALARELWWASATEHDSPVPAHGVGVATPIAIPLVPGVEVRRSLGLDVTETQRWTKRGRTAHLRLDLCARVEALADPDAPAPILDATRLVPDAAVPRPDRSAGELPTGFEAELEGVGGLVEVTAERVAWVTDPRSSPRPSGPAAEPGPGPAAEHALGPGVAALAGFLRWFAGGYAPAGGPSSYAHQAAIYAVRARDGQAFWIGRSSSMGVRSDRRLIDALAAAAAPLGPVDTGGFVSQPSLIRELLGPLDARALGPAAAALATLIAALTDEHPDRAAVEREVYVRTALIDEISGEWTRAFVVDPRPYAGPDPRAWLVAWTDSWTE